MICEEQTADIISKMPRLGVSTARLFIVLYDRKNRVTTLATIEDFVPLDHADYDMSRGAISSLVKRLRYQLSMMGCPIEIRAIYGLGYMMVVDKDWQPEHVLNPLA